MRIVFTTPYPMTTVTGIGLFIRYLSEHLLDDNGSVMVVEPSRHSSPAGLGNILLAGHTFREIIRTRKRFDVIHAQALHLQSLVAALLGRVLGKRVVLTIHGPSSLPANGYWSVRSSLERLILRVPDRVVLIASFLEKVVKFHGIVIPNGVPVKAIRHVLGDRQRVRNELGFDDVTVITYVGRVTFDKGVNTLLEVARSPPVVNKRIQLLLVGPVSNDVQQAIARAAAHGDPVVAIGEVSNPWSYLAASDVYVLASIREGVPLSLLEAMACGLPVVSTAVGGIPEVIEDGKNGILVPTGDIPAFREALRRILSSPEEAERLGARAAKTAAALYDSRIMYEAYKDLYSNLADPAFP